MKIKRQRHGFSGHPLYNIWHGMMRRCYNSKHQAFRYYGGVGIHMCKEWRENQLEFILWGFSNGWDWGLTIDRIDNRLSYYPQNCRFVTKSENSKNMNKDFRRNPLRWIAAPYHPI
jgi:hypothetical protein